MCIQCYVCFLSSIEPKCSNEPMVLCNMLYAEQLSRLLYLKLRVYWYCQSKCSLIVVYPICYMRIFALLNECYQIHTIFKLNSVELALPQTLLLITTQHGIYVFYLSDILNCSKVTLWKIVSIFTQIYELSWK